MSLSPYGKNKLMDTILSGPVFISLHVGEPGVDGSNEIKNNDYMRQSVANHFTAAVNGEKKTAQDLYFKKLPAAEITHIAVWDAAKGGNLLWSSELMAKKTVFDGDTLLFTAGDIILGLT